MNGVRSFLIVLFGGMFLLVSCQTVSEETESEVTEKTLAFVRGFYNLDRNEVLRICMPEDRKKLDYVFSNITEEDLALINQIPSAEVVLKGLFWENDTCARVTVLLSNGFAFDSIAKPLRIISKEEQVYRVVRIAGQWYVRMGDRLQSER